ncbi:hypothetical protein [uncultured Aliiroseovarius sp.]|uniref:hypothetical protein n=1 Tax=uncultured Aliiroseovarius sp. TaxID=1658783 RepID=UPI002622E660|nr:hypothetical protein [uncultured Aliiroseovarius sp.]
MIKKFLILASCAGLLAGCVSETTSGPVDTKASAARSVGIPTGKALEEFAPRFKIGITQHANKVAADPRTVEARLAAFARQCIDGKTIKTQRYTQMGMPFGGAMNQTYRARISNEDGIKRLIISQQLSGAVLTTAAGKKANVQLSTQILSDGAGGTLLKTTRNKTFFDLSAAAIEWAKGSSTSCPGLFAG